MAKRKTAKKSATKKKAPEGNAAKKKALKRAGTKKAAKKHPLATKIAKKSTAKKRVVKAVPKKPAARPETHKPAGVKKLSQVPEQPKMEIPDALSGLTVDDETKLAFIATLLHDEPCSIIVKGTAFFDDVLLKDVLVAYCRKAGTAAGYTEAQVPKMTFDKKITSLAGLALSPDALLLRDLAVAKMTPMRKVRNKTAHKAGLTSPEVEELWGNADNRQLLANFPTNFKAECAAVQAALEGLLNHRDFGGE